MHRRQPHYRSTLALRALQGALLLGWVVLIVALLTAAVAHSLLQETDTSARATFELLRALRVLA